MQRRSRRWPAVQLHAHSPQRTASGARIELPAPLPQRRIVLPILMYHRVNVAPASTPAISRRLTVDPEDFARQMGWLKRRGYRTVT